MGLGCHSERNEEPPYLLLWLPLLSDSPQEPRHPERSAAKSKDLHRDQSHPNFPPFQPQTWSLPTPVILERSSRISVFANTSLVVNSRRESASALSQSTNRVLPVVPPLEFFTFNRLPECVEISGVA